MTPQGHPARWTTAVATPRGGKGATLQGRGTRAAIISSIVFPLALTQFIARYAGSNWPEQDQGEISGLSRGVSSLGSSLGTALVGLVLVSTAFIGNEEYRAALIVMAVIGAIGLVAARLIPPETIPARGQA